MVSNDLRLPLHELLLHRMRVHVRSPRKTACSSPNSAWFQEVQNPFLQFVPYGNPRTRQSQDLCPDG